MGQLRKFATAQPIKARVADMGHRHLVVVEERRHHRGAHAGILRLALRFQVNGLVGVGDFARQRDICPALAVRLRMVGTPLRECLGQSAAQQRRRHAAGHFTGVVAAHAVGEDGQPQHRVGEDRVLVVRTHPPRI